MSNEWISARLKSLRITKGSLAKSLGIDPARVSEIVAGRRNVQVSELPVMAEILQMSTEDLVARLTPRKVALIQEAQRAAAINPPPLPPPPQPLPTPSAAVADLPSGGLMPRNLPVYGCARGGVDGSFEMNGQGMDYVERPPSLAGARNAYAVYVQGDSMSPRFEAGWLLHVNPNRPVRRGDNVTGMAVGRGGLDPSGGRHRRDVATKFAINVNNSLDSAPAPGVSQKRNKTRTECRR